MPSAYKFNDKQNFAYIHHIHFGVDKNTILVGFFLFLSLIESWWKINNLIWLRNSVVDMTNGYGLYIQNDKFE